ncbi:response regulator [Dyella sp. 2HG41-7]|uniref:response regulator n=1 Tax=Dyella sp. 2HG41-7 TaxID=2883239 RepID=UPI001F392E06
MTNEPTPSLKAFVVEDQPMVASALMDALPHFGIDVVGHVYDIPAALGWLERGQIPDVALIDMMLPSGPAYPVIDRLSELPTTILLITGMDGDFIPAAYQHFPRLEKPFGIRDLVSAIEALRK